jgi:thymidylate synthase
VWDQNANENQQWLANPFRKGEDDLGDVYGAMWRRWPALKQVQIELENTLAIQKQLWKNGWQLETTASDTGLKYDIWFKEIDQLGDCVRKLILNPSDRRILFHGWNPAKLDEIALPACHLLYQFLPNLTRGELNLAVYIRSWDTFLGGSYNIAEAGLMLELVSRLTGYKAKRVTIFSGDTHIYQSHLHQVEEQLTRVPYMPPQLEINNRVPTFEQLRLEAKGEISNTTVETAIRWLSLVEPSDFTLNGYNHHPELKAPMAV